MFKRSLVVLGKCQSLRSSVSPLNQRVMTYATKRPTPTNVSASFMPAKSAHEMEEETDEEFDRRYYEYLSRPDIDGWEIRKALNDLMGLDLIPEPKIIEAAFRAARRLNDHSICVRYLEAIKWKAHVHDKEIYPWIIQELQPVMDELGISTPEDLGYDKPEFALPAV